MSISLLNLKRNIAREIGYIQVAPSATGTTTTIVAGSTSSELDSGDDTRLLENGFAYVEADSAGTPLNVGETRRISGYTPSNATVEVARAFSNATTSTMTIGLYLGLPPGTSYGINKGIAAYVNETLRNLKYRTLHLLTLITDGDMETSGVTNWTASSSTLTKSTTTGVQFGKQALRVANSGASGYARSALVSVAEGQTYHCLADVTVASGTAKLILYDETNGAEIDSATTAERRAGYLWLDNGLIPSGCLQVSVRLSGTEASADAYWDNVTLRQQGARYMALPSWLTDPDWLEGTRYVRGGSKEQDNDSYTIDERTASAGQWWHVEEDHSGATPYRLRFEPTPNSATHLFAQALRPYAELSADSDTTDADQDWVRAVVLARIYADRADKAKLARWLPEARRLHRRWQPVAPTNLQMAEHF